jgi:hypothetical protein
VSQCELFLLPFRSTFHFYNLKFHSQMTLQRDFTHKTDLWLMVTLIFHILLVLDIIWCRSHCSSFGIMTVLRAEYPRIVVRFPAGARNLFLLQSHKTDSGACPASYRWQRRLFIPR